MTLIDKSKQKVSKNYRLSRGSIDVIAELADVYGTNVSAVLEAMVSRFGPRILEEEKRRLAAVNPETNPE